MCLMNAVNIQVIRFKLWDRQTDRQTDIQTDRQTDRQTSKREMGGETRKRKEERNTKYGIQNISCLCCCKTIIMSENTSHCCCFLRSGSYPLSVQACCSGHTSLSGLSVHDNGYMLIDNTAGVVSSLTPSRWQSVPKGEPSTYQA